MESSDEPHSGGEWPKPRGSNSRGCDRGWQRDRGAKICASASAARSCSTARSGGSQGDYHLHRRSVGRGQDGIAEASESADAARLRAPSSSMGSKSRACADACLTRCGKNWACCSRPARCSIRWRFSTTSRFRWSKRPTSSEEEIADAGAVRRSNRSVWKASRTKYPSEISGGMQKRAALARALVHRPKILMLDEPTTGLDPARTGAIHRLIRETQRKYGLTVVMVSHDVPAVFEICDRVGFIHHGKMKLLWDSPGGNHCA